jgi:hypothetical protein
MNPVGKPENPPVRFDERGWETGRRSLVSTRSMQSATSTNDRPTGMSDFLNLVSPDGNTGGSFDDAALDMLQRNDPDKALLPRLHKKLMYSRFWRTEFIGDGPISSETANHELSDLVRPCLDENYRERDARNNEYDEGYL